MLGILMVWARDRHRGLRATSSEALPTLTQHRRRSSPSPCCSSSAARSARARSSRCTSGCPTRWKARRPSPRSSTPRRWSPPAFTCWRASSSSSTLAPRRADVIAWIGGITALLAALMATQQNDIKRILAYSTLSQLGYMVMAVGLAAAERRRCSTSPRTRSSRRCSSSAPARSSTRCITSRTSGRWAACARRCQWTFLTFTVGYLALIGVPFFSGFFSKDAILTRRVAAEQTASSPLALFTAFLTAFYMTRLFVVAFLGKPRSDAAEPRATMAPLAMTVPLIILAVLSVIAGYVPCVTRQARRRMVPHAHHSDAHWLIVGISITRLRRRASALASVLYKGKDKDPLLIPLFANKFYFDETLRRAHRRHAGPARVDRHRPRPMVHRWPRRPRPAAAHRLGHRLRAALLPGRQPPGLRLPLRRRRRAGHLSSRCLSCRGLEVDGAST